MFETVHVETFADKKIRTRKARPDFLFFLIT